MPRAFDEDEKRRVKAALMEAGLARFQREGIRAARIDDFSRDAGIAKGSFYAFFPSKEELFMAIVEAREEMHRAHMTAFLREATDEAVPLAGRFFDTVLAQIETDPVLNIVLANNEIPHLVRKLGPERFEASQRSDDEFARQLAKLWGTRGRPTISHDDFLSLLTIMFAVATQRQHMTANQYQPAVKLLRDMFVRQLTGASK